MILVQKTFFAMNIHGVSDGAGLNMAIKYVTWVTALAVTAVPTCALRADDLFRSDGWAALSSDRRASAVGDSVTVVVVQAAQSSTTLQNGSRRSTNVGGSITAGNINETGDIRIGGSYSGRGETTRTERFVTQLTVSVTERLANGDLMISGVQTMRINDEQTTVVIRGRIRPADLDGANRVPSTRIADAQIDYGGRGFVSRSARPGLVNRVFAFLGLG
jgi:flagellar L-ring protein FlgH